MTKKMSKLNELESLEWKTDHDIHYIVTNGHAKYDKLK